MEETLIWVAGLIGEILLVSTVVLAMLLWRARKARQVLLAQLAGQKNPSPEQAVAAEVVSETPMAISATPAAEIEKPPAETRIVEVSTSNVPLTDAAQVAYSDSGSEPISTASASLTDELDQLLASIDNARLDESVERLHQKLQASTQSLQRLAAELPPESPTAEQGRVEFASLQVNLQEMTDEVDSLQRNNTDLQQDLRSKTKLLEQTAAEARDNTEQVLHYARKLRVDITTLRDKLKEREGDVQRLQSEKESLAAEFEALNREYVRIYATTTK